MEVTKEKIIALLASKAVWRLLRHGYTNPNNFYDDDDDDDESEDNPINDLYELSNAASAGKLEVIE